MPTKSFAASDSKFDYGALLPSVEKFLRGHADRIRRQCTSCIIQTGKALLEAKRHLSHGEFLLWVESEVGIPCRTAQAYMRAAQWAVGKSAAVAHLPASVIYVLSSNRAPEEFVIGVLERAEAGEQIAASIVRQQLKAFSPSGHEKYVAAGRTSQQVQGERLVQGAMTGAHVVELVALLARNLSETEFARVCQILTSDSFLSDPDLAEKLEYQFRVAAESRLAPA